MKKYSHILIIIIIILINIGCDQGTKHYAKKHFKGHGQIEVIDRFFVIRYTENSGAFLGLGSNLPKHFKKAILIFMPIITLLGMLIYIIVNNHLSIYEAACMASIIGGGISNMIDRVIFSGQVTDFLNFGIGSIRTGILNLADISITFGALAFLFFSIKKIRAHAVE